MSPVSFSNGTPCLPAVCEHHPGRRVDCLFHDFGGDAPRCIGCELGTTQVGLAGGISRGFLSPEFGPSPVLDLGSGSKREREERAPDERRRCVDRLHRSGFVRATGYPQSQRLPPLGQPPTRFRCHLKQRHSEEDRSLGRRSSVVARRFPALWPRADFAPPYFDGASLAAILVNCAKAASRSSAISAPTRPARAMSPYPSGFCP